MAPEWGHEFAVTELEPGNRVLPARPFSREAKPQSLHRGFCAFTQGDTMNYAAAITDLRLLLSKIGRAEFRAAGYAAQLRSYRAAA